MSVSVIIELTLPLYKHIDQGDEHQIIILKALYVVDGFGQNIFIVTVSDKLSWQWRFWIKYKMAAGFKNTKAESEKYPFVHG